jgi:hypothetical protein
MRNLEFRLRHWLLVGVLSLLSVPSFAQGISVQLDGRTLYFDQPPAMIDGRLLVPLRGIFEALAADVLYDAGTRSIKATKGSTVVQLQLGSRTALIDGRTVYLDVPADTVGGRTMVPLRFVSEALGADVKWNGATKTVTIASTGGAAPGGTTGSTTPTPPVATDAPRIDRVVHNGTAALSPGDSLEVIVYGDPGATARFEILGHTQAVSLPEVSPGRYQTRYTIPYGLQVRRGVVLAHLTRNGRETAMESDRQLTIRSEGDTGNANWQTYPESNGTINTLRPQLSVTFPETVLGGTHRLYVDGIDFTSQAQVSGNRLYWTPQYDLSAGRHQAQVRASGNSGRTLDHQWAFTIDTNAGGTANFVVQTFQPSNGEVVNSWRPTIGATFNQNVSSVTLTVDNTNVTNLQGVQRYSNGINWTPNYNMTPGTHQASVTAVDAYNRQISQAWTFTIGSNNNTTNPVGQTLMVTNIGNGSLLPPVFNVQGSAAPGRQVNVLVEYSPDNILEVITGASRRISQSALVGSNGRFDVQIDASAIRSGQAFRVTVSDGGASPTQVFSVRRQ